MPRKRRDLTGLKFGRLTVTALAEAPKGKIDKWFCDCDCGTRGIVVPGNSLVHGITKSCGCLRKEHYNKLTKDLTGQKFGRLTVIKRAEKRGGVYWLCDCDCGTKEVLVGTGNLVRGYVKSCGCLKREYIQNRTIDLTGQKFGRLTVRERSEKKGKIFWVCDCDCGTKGVIKSTDYLRHEANVSCGCVRQERIRRKDLTGQKFGRLTVIGKSDKRTKSGDVYYICDCDCGTKGILVSRSSLVAKDSHKQISCGCWVKEGLHSVNRENNRDYVILKYLYRKLKTRNRRLGFNETRMITMEEFKTVINQPCVYCGMENSDTTKEPYSYVYKRKNLDGGQIDFDYEMHHNGVDRIDSSIGYEPGNVVSCCKFCNMAKNDRSREEFLKWAEKAYQYFGKLHRR